ncbi:MAG TPA: anion permease [Chlamydiales bacterium]|jgi:PiT family inorganic phosphate transporter/sodium-dependent phosphate transporter|nr:anion permease [Chlamydiales bacterium]
MSWLLITTLLLGFYMAWNIGANDVANAMGTSVGSKALTLKRAVFLAAILEFAGAFFVGSSVSETIQHGIITPQIFEADPMIFVLGMMGSLLATGVLLQIASYFGLPISTTHAIVGAVLGFGICLGGVDAVQWGEVVEIVLSWVLSPLLSGVISYFIFLLIQRKILYVFDPVAAARKWSPLLVFFCFLIASMSFLYHGLKQLELDLSFIQALSFSSLIGGSAALVSQGLFTLRTSKIQKIQCDGFHPYQAVSLEKALHHMQRVQRTNQDNRFREKITGVLSEMRNLHEIVKKNTQYSQAAMQYSGVEKIFVYLQILSACLVAFAHGANDVANAIGPVAAVMSILKTNSLGSHTYIPSWLLALGGGGIVLGLATWGWRVIETIGEKITELTPTRGFCAEFGAAFTILSASKLGLPISTTHALVGAVFGVGMARGIQALNLQMLKDIVISWVVTLPFCAILSIAAFYLLRHIHHLTQ